MEQVLRKTKKILNFTLSRLAALFLIIMSLLVIYQVFTRYILNNPSDFTEEIVRYLLMWTSFVGAAYAFSTRQHMALLMVHNKLDDRGRRNLMVLADAAVLFFALFVMTIGGTKLATSPLAD